MADIGAVRYAGFWVRFAASVIDSILVSAVIYLMLLAAYGRDYFQPYIEFLRARNVDLLTRMLALNDGMQPYSGTASNLINWALPAILIVVFWMARQATPGKMVFGIRIVDAATLQKPSAAQDIGRYLAYFVSLLVLGLGFLAIAFDKRKQGWHDKLAGTVVVYG